MAEKHIINITFKSKPEHAKEFEEFMQSVKMDLPATKGCEDVTVFRHKEDPLIYTLIEHWTKEELHSAHIEHVVASGTWARIEAMLDEAPTSIVLSSF